MAFESYLNQDKAKPKKAQRITVGVSVGVHGALLLAGLIYSFWHVEELSAPAVTVTFLNNAPPPPPPPPPPPKKKKKSTKVRKPTPEVVQPSKIVQPEIKEEEEEAIEEEEEEGAVEDGEEGGVAGGVVGGVVGGVLGSMGDNQAPVRLSPKIGAAQISVDVSRPPYLIVLPPVLNKPGNRFWALTKVCVDTQGRVKSLKFMKKADPLLDAEIRKKVMIWKFTPYKINGHPVPFCMPYRISIEARL